MSERTSGTFQVQLTPQPGTEGVGDPSVGRLAMEKRFSGGLEGTSRGEMLSSMTAVEGSAGYVAIERVEGTLAGRRGTFSLQHSGTMDRGAAQLVITVIPDSGTEQLAGLSGRMTVDVADGEHRYTFEYTLPEAAD